MVKKLLSIILLGLIFVSFLLTLMIFIDTGIALYSLENNRKEASETQASSGYLIGYVIGSLATWGALFFFGFMSVSAGFFASLANTQIVPSSIIGRISKVFLYINSAFATVLILLFFFNVILNILV